MPVTRAALDTASRAALRAILSARPDASAVSMPVLVTEQPGQADPPVLNQAEFIERDATGPVHVGEPFAGIEAFLDGTQSARVLAWADGVPWVFGSAGAVVRTRRDRQLTTWDDPLLRRNLYLPLAYTKGPDVSADDLRVVDTTARALGPVPSRHPAAVLERALLCLQRDREALERALAERWVGRATGVLCIDGPLPAAGAARASANVVGVVKTHRTIHADGVTLDQVFALRPGERSPVFVVSGSGRDPVASWYLRLRDPRGHDLLWGLVRAEIAMGGDLSARAGDVSRWLLAENAPLALPDSRWDKMTYGVRSCEAFLRAIS